MPSPTMPCVDRLHTASEHLIDTVDALADAEWSTASLLPAWSRAPSLCLPAGRRTRASK